MDMFDSAQLNLVILQSGLTYQFLKEQESKKLERPDTPFGYLAETYIEKTSGQHGVWDVPLFPFTASYLSPNDGIFLNIQNGEDKSAYHEAFIVKEKVREIDPTLSVQ